ncbi:MAG: DUF2849 domain-containing protein [Alphaproteobacteria bacterium]|nr:MAG: DUF2849 domain-containing protein [Alphaproteobacteria bacterium]
MALQVYTASLLKEGLVAYLRLEENVASWTRDIREATAAAEGTLLDALKNASEQAEKNNLVIAPYAIDVLEDAEGFSATTKREQIRAMGPTIRLPKDRAVPTTANKLQAA